MKMPKSFQNSQAIKTGLSDSHKMHLTLLKVFYNEQKPLIQYRSCKKFTNEAFINHLQNAFFFQFSSRWENRSFQIFQKPVDVILTKNTPLKTRNVEQTRLSLIKLQLKKS